MNIEPRKEGEKHESNADNSKPVVRPVGSPADMDSVSGAKDGSSERASDNATINAKTDLQSGAGDGKASIDHAHNAAPTVQPAGAALNEIVERAYQLYNTPNLKGGFRTACRRACEEAYAIGFTAGDYHGFDRATPKSNPPVEHFSRIDNPPPSPRQ